MPVLVMCNRAARRLVPLCSIVALAVSASACDVLDEGGATVFVFSTHHATPENGVFPERGDDDKPRQFLSDEGWEITLLESYVTVSAVSLVRCDNTEYPLDMFWGPCPEDLRDRDLETLTVAGNKLPSADYCKLLVQYPCSNTGQKLPSPSSTKSFRSMPFQANLPCAGTSSAKKGGANGLVRSKV